MLHLTTLIGCYGVDSQFKYNIHILPRIILGNSIFMRSCFIVCSCLTKLTKKSKTTDLISYSTHIESLKKSRKLKANLKQNSKIGQK